MRMSRVRRLGRARATSATFACLAALLLAQLLTPPPASAWTPAGTITLEGRGYGHGKGLSQYGAKGAAERGLTYEQILGFYYPGTARATYGGPVKVLISADTTDTVVLPATGLTVRDFGNATVTVLPTNLGAQRWKMHPLSGTDKVLVSWFDGTAWKAWKQLVGLGEFFASTPTTLVLPGGVEKPYRGTLRYLGAGTGSRTVNALGMDDYLKGVVPAEMPSSWHLEALRSQVVAARTFAVNQRAARAGLVWELCDTTQCQVYGGVRSESARTNEAIRLTPGSYLTYDGKPAYAQFSASNGGHTAPGGVAYLPAKPDQYDAYPVWRVAVSTAPLQKAHPEIGTLLQVRVQTRDASGRVALFRLDGSVKDIDIPGTEVRTRLGLKSTLFRLV